VKKPDGSAAPEVKKSDGSAAPVAKADPWAGSAGAKPSKPSKPSKPARRPSHKPRAPMHVPMPASEKYGVLGLEADVRADIEIDGAPLHRRTPEVIELPAGKHTVRLVSEELELENVFEVDIKPNTMHPVYAEFLGADE
jgi:hypothetical protein